MKRVSIWIICINVSLGCSSDFTKQNDGDTLSSLSGYNDDYRDGDSLPDRETPIRIPESSGSDGVGNCALNIETLNWGKFVGAARLMNSMGPTIINADSVRVANHTGNLYIRTQNLESLVNARGEEIVVVTDSGSSLANLSYQEACLYIRDFKTVANVGKNMYVIGGSSTNRGRVQKLANSGRLEIARLDVESIANAGSTFKAVDSRIGQMANVAGDVFLTDSILEKAINIKGDIYLKNSIVKQLTNHSGKIVLWP